MSSVAQSRRTPPEQAAGASARSGPGEEAAGPAAVRLSEVSKVYGRGPSAVLALDRVSLTVAPGEFTCLIGASGCGKSTLLSLVAGLDQPTAGSISTEGRRVTLMFLAQDADVLLMDEPFGALDAMTRDLLHEELERIWGQQGLTVLFVTHNVREAVRLGDRVVVLSSRPGRVIEEYRVPRQGPRRIDSPEVARLAATITDRLREEMSRHGD